MTRPLVDEFEDVLCLCPSSRLSLASLVLSTWTGVRRIVLAETELPIAGFAAVIVMDGFVTRAIVERLAATRPVIVLAWNGMFEIEHYRKTLRGLDVIYMGTDETFERRALPAPDQRRLHVRTLARAVSNEVAVHRAG